MELVVLQRKKALLATIPVVGEEGAAIFDIPPMLLVPPCAAETPPKEVFCKKNVCISKMFSNIVSGCVRL